MTDFSAAIIAGVVSLAVGFTTAIVTIRVANVRAGVDESLAQLRGDFDQRIALAKGDIDERIAQQKLSIEQQQANRRPFLQKQLDLCFEATDAAARLATEINPTEWEKSRFDFWRLYWGVLGIVEDQAVAVAMVNLGNTVPLKPVASPGFP